MKEGENLYEAENGEKKKSKNIKMEKRKWQREVKNNNINTTKR